MFNELKKSNYSHVWFVAEDLYYFAKVREWYKGQNPLLILPTKEEVIKKIQQGELFCVLAPYYPPEEIKSLFVTVFLENRYQPLTTQEYLYANTLSEQERKDFERLKLSEKLGLKLYKVNLKEEDLVGLNAIKRYLYRVKTIKNSNLRPKGVFLVGVPGTGKSFSAKYAASVLQYYLVELNVARIIEDANPIALLHRIFKFLETIKEGLVLWIDEIEKMFAGIQSDTVTKRVFGQLLTILNDLNTEVGYKINGIFWVTANNIKDIVENNPEFLRKGRFDELFFIDTPLKKDAEKMFALYKKKYPFNFKSYDNKTYEETAIDLVETVYLIAIQKYSTKDVQRFIYTPAEIEDFTKEMAIREILKRENKNNIEVMKLLYPEREFITLISNPKFRSYPFFSSDYNKFISKMIEENKKEHYVDYVDFLFLLVRNEPLVVRLRDSIAYMRSQEKFFVSGD